MESSPVSQLIATKRQPKKRPVGVEALCQRPGPLCSHEVATQSKPEQRLVGLHFQRETKGKAFLTLSCTHTHVHMHTQT